MALDDICAWSQQVGSFVPCNSASQYAGTHGGDRVTGGPDIVQNKVQCT